MDLARGRCSGGHPWGLGVDAAERNRGGRVAAVAGQRRTHVRICTPASSAPVCRRLQGLCCTHVVLAASSCACCQLCVAAAAEQHRKHPTTLSNDCAWFRGCSSIWRWTCFQGCPRRSHAVCWNPEWQAGAGACLQLRTGVCGGCAARPGGTCASGGGQGADALRGVLIPRGNCGRAWTGGLLGLQG